MNAEEYLKQQLSNRKLWNTETDDCYQAITEIMEEYAQSHITQLEQQVSDLETALIITKNSRKFHIEKNKVLELRVKELEEVLTKIVDFGNSSNYNENLLDVKVFYIAEQALNKKDI